MNRKLSIYLKAFLKAKLFRARIPLLIGWDITNKCNSDCRYCGITEKWRNELNTQKVMELLDGLYRLGTKRIHFGGGEPLLREDLGKIIEKCKVFGISLSVLTNGSLFEERLPWLKKVDMVKVSFDGPESVHDEIRQRKGSYREVLQALALSKQAGIRVCLNTTLSRYNLEEVDFVLSTASRFGVPVKFQPVNNLLSCSKDIEEIICPDDKYKKVIDKLIQYKTEKYKKLIINSFAGLTYLKNYPQVRNLSCCAGLLFFRIDPEGNMYRCSGTMDLLYPLDSGSSQIVTRLKEAMAGMSFKGCRRCLCTSSLDLQLAYSGKLSAVRELIGAL